MVTPIIPWPEPGINMHESEKWLYRFAFLPHQCKASGRWFWLGKHYMYKCKIVSPIDSIEITKWYRKEEAIQQIIAETQPNI